MLPSIGGGHIPRASHLPTTKAAPDAALNTGAKTKRTKTFTAADSWAATRPKLPPPTPTPRWVKVTFAGVSTVFSTSVYLLAITPLLSLAPALLTIGLPLVVIGSLSLGYWLTGRYFPQVY